MEREKTDRLEYWINYVTGKVRELDPDATVTISKDTYEDEDVDVEVRTAGNRRQRLSSAMAGVTSRILADEGYHILVLVLDREEETAGAPTF